MAQTRPTHIYRNDGHTNHIADVMNQMRKDALLCDVTLVTNGVETPSHKIILAASSHYFYTIFTNSGENQNRVILNGVNSEAFSSIMEYIYTSEVEITDRNVEDILLAANLLGMIDLRDACLQFLKDHLHSANCFKIRAIANLHDFQDLLIDVEDFIHKNFSDLAKSQEFLQLSHEEVSGIISKDELNVPSEEEIFECILTWIRHDLETRQQHLASLVKNVRICYLPKEYIKKTILEEVLVKNDPECKDFIIEAFEVYASEGDSKTRAIKRRKYENLSNKILLVAGGFMSEKSVEYYDFKGTCWFKSADMPIDRDGAGLTILNGKLYVIGGYMENRVDIYDAATDQWIPGIGMHFNRQYLGVAVLKDCIYAVGGDSGEGSLNTVEKFDPETEQWSVIAPMLNKRYTHGIGVIDDILYAVGGYGGGHIYLNSVESYDPTTNTWTYVKSMNLKRPEVAVGVLNGIIYAVGGYDGTILESAEAFNPKTGNWTMIKDMHNRRYGAAVLATNNLLYVIGGDDGSKRLASVEMYDPNTTTWTILPSCMSTKRSHHCAVVIDKFN